MSTTPIRDEMKSFIRGLITEATELTFPEDALSDVLNMDLDKKGVLKRRNGLALETGNTPRFYTGFTYNQDVTKAYRWNNVANNHSQDIIVVQYGYRLVFYLADDSLTDTRIASFTINDPAGGTYQEVDLWNWCRPEFSSVTAAQMEAEPVSFAHGNGKLFIVHRYIETTVIEYDSVSNHFTVTKTPVRIRDFDGKALVDPFDDLEYKPYLGQMTDAHWYNLSNQGWSTRFDEVKAVYDARNRFPSNTEQWQYGKYIDVTTGKEVFSYDQFKLQEFGSSRAPMGHFITEAFWNKVETPIGYGQLINFVAGSTNESVLRISSTSAEVAKLTVGDFIEMYKAAVSTVTYDNGGGCGAAVNFPAEQYNRYRVTTVNVASGYFEVAPFDIDPYRLTANERKAAQANNNSTATTLSLDLVNHGLNTGDRIRFWDYGPTVWNFNAGGGCPGTNFNPATLGWVTVTKVSDDEFSVPATLTGFTTWCDNSPAIPFERTILPNFVTFCNNPASNIRWRLWKEFDEGDIVERPQHNCFFQGRHVQGGIEYQGKGSFIYISKIMYGDNHDPGRCYQDGDPTSEHTNALLPTDGLVLNIQEMEKLVGLFQLGSGFVCLATNGIWYIWGGSGAPFTATNWTVDKISDIKCHGERNVVESTIYNREGNKESHLITLWAKEGVFQLYQANNDTLPSLINLTIDTIQTFYEDITETKQATASGAYNPDTKKITWIYEGSTSGIKDKALVYNVKTGAWMPWTFDSSTYDVLEVVQMRAYQSIKDQRLKFICNRSADNYIVAADLSDEDSYDWTSIDAAGYVETGHYLGESASLEKQIKYATMYFRRTETQFIDDGGGNPILNKQSSALMRIYWDWTDHANANKWSPQREVYRFKRQFGGSIGDPFDNGYPLTVSKNKIRGSGKSFRLRLDTVPGKRMEWVGWTFRAESRTEE